MLAREDYKSGFTIPVELKQYFEHIGHVEVSRICPENKWQKIKIVLAGHVIWLVILLHNDMYMNY